MVDCLSRTSIARFAMLAALFTSFYSPSALAFSFNNVWKTPPSSTTTALSAVQKPGSSKAFLLGVGFTQFLVSKELNAAGITTVLMCDAAKKQGMVDNWTPPPAKCVTNGQGEWEDEAKDCTCLVVCPEASDIPGRTVSALLSRMPNAKRLVILSPTGTSSKQTVKKEDNWLFNRMMILGGKRVGAAGDNMEYARELEDVAREAESSGRVDEAIIVHRGVLRGGGGGDSGDYGLGDLYYKVCGSEPEEVVERTFDKARLGCKIVLGDSIDAGEKKILKGDDETTILANLSEELKDKTHRTTLAKSIVACLTIPDPPREIGVLCDLSESLPTLEEVQATVKSTVGAPAAATAAS